jgi:hypothetical protein
MSIAASSSSIGDFQRDYLFQMMVVSTPKGYKRSDSVLQDKIDLYMTKGIFPSRKTAEIAVKWGGETVYYSGVDESPKTGDLFFRLDNGSKIKKFWENLKDLTGDLAAHAAALKQNQVLDMEVYLLSTDKQTVNEARKLENVVVYSVEDITLDKEGSGISTFKVHISWDRSTPNLEAEETELEDPNSGAYDDEKLSNATSNDESGGAPQSE